MKLGSGYIKVLILGATLSALKFFSFADLAYANEAIAKAKRPTRHSQSSQTKPARYPTSNQNRNQNPPKIDFPCDLGSLPKHVGNYKTRGSAMLNAAKYVEALNCFEQAIQLNPNDPEIWNGRGVALAKLGQYEGAIVSYDRAIAIPPGQIALNSAKRRIQANDYYLWWFNRATALYDLNRYEEALPSYDRAIQLKPNYEPAWYYKGVTLSRLQQPFQAAITAYDISIQIKLAKENQLRNFGNEHLNWVSKGAALSAAKQYAQAIAAYDQATQLKPESFPIWYFKGNALVALERYPEAIVSYTQSVELAPEFSQGWYELGNALLQLQQYSKALESFERATRSDKFWKDNDSIAGTWYGYGVALYHTSKYGQAVAAFDRALKIQPSFANAAEMRSQALNQSRR